MRAFKIVCLLSCCLLVFALVLAASPATDPCALPHDLQNEVAEKYPGAKVVTLSDLSEDDKVFFQKDHGDACPGLVRVDFYGDGKPTVAFVLFAKHRGTENTVLVVARRVRERWRVIQLDTGGPNAPVVWSQTPGRYDDVYGNKTIRAIHPVIAFCGYESWSIVYAWKGNHVDRIWLSD